MSEPKKVFTTGFFDQLNAGHVRFLTEAAHFGSLHVGIGQDENHRDLKGCDPIMSLADRLFMVQSLGVVSDALVVTGRGELDFAVELEALRPDVFVASDSNNSLAKREFCAAHGIDYQVIHRGKVVEATSHETLYFPYRLCLTGGWLDQPWVSQIHPGAVTVLNLEPTRDYAFRCGMATSTRKTAKRIWSTFPTGDPENLAQILFGAENPPGKTAVSGSQDALGLCLPGFNTLHYSGGYWPDRIESDCNPELAAWFESILFMVPIKPRPDGYDPLTEKNLTASHIALLADSTEMAVSAAQQRDPQRLGRALRQTLEAWRLTLPNTVPPSVYQEVLAMEGNCHGCSLSGCGGGYLLVVADECPPNGLTIKVRTKESA